MNISRIAAFLIPFLLGSACSASAASVKASRAAEPKRPNIILFLVDDMGWQDTSLPFWREEDGTPKPTFLNKRYRTPNMEALGKQGMVFTNAYAQPICSPSRCSQPAGTRASGTTHLPLTEEKIQYRMEKPFTQVLGLPALLKKQGYTTIHCGKAHFGSKNTPGANPRLFGFDYNIAGTEIGGPADYRGSRKYGTGGAETPGCHPEKPQGGGQAFLPVHVPLRHPCPLRHARL